MCEDAQHTLADSARQASASGDTSYSNADSNPDEVAMSDWRKMKALMSDIDPALAGFPCDAWWPRRIAYVCRSVVVKSLPPPHATDTSLSCTHAICTRFMVVKHDKHDANIHDATTVKPS